MFFSVLTPDSAKNFLTLYGLPPNFLVPKAQVEFTVGLNGYINILEDSEVKPTTRRNLSLELLDKIVFKDKIYTNGEHLIGYINKVEPDVKKGEIKIGVIFEPDDYSYLIIERGIPLNDNSLIDESGNREETIIEGRSFI